MQGARRTGGETADEGRLAGLGPDLGEELSSGLKVGGPAEPAWEGMLVYEEGSGVRVIAYQHDQHPCT